MYQKEFLADCPFGDSVSVIDIKKYLIFKKNSYPARPSQKRTPVCQGEEQDGDIFSPLKIFLPLHSWH